MSTDSTTSIVFNNRAPTGLMLGRFQPWHAGHRALFEEILKNVDQVCIMVRDTYGTSQKDPFDFDTVKSHIVADLDPMYHGRYSILLVPNITGVYYGRDVGYSVQRISLPDEIESISATNIRSAMQAV
jgi:adenylylsulfate kinase